MPKAEISSYHCRGVRTVPAVLKQQIMEIAETPEPCGNRQIIVWLRTAPDLPEASTPR